MIFILEAFISGCVSKVINDSKDYSWDKIKSVINDRHDQNISTKICRVIEKSLNIVTDNTYKNSDKIYDAIEKLFNEFKNHGDTLESVKCGLGILGTDISDQRCENFLEEFYQGIRLDDDLYKAIIMDLEQKGIKISQEEFRKINEKIDKNHTEIIEKIDSINDNLNRSSLINEENITTKILKFQNNKKQDYVKNWNSRLFLHLDNDERPITLADAFIMPDYDAYLYHSKINGAEYERLEQMFENFLDTEKTEVMLIAGVPGIGKTSITSWFANKYKQDDRVIILRFRDWDYDDFENGLLNAICNILCCNRKDLNDKILILDGFDEIKCLNNCKNILNEFINDKNDLERSKIIITSRPSYIEPIHFKKSIVLRPFNRQKIKKFYKNITGKELNEMDVDIQNIDVLGVPVILYMSIISNIDITKSTSKPELYNRIFAETGGIFDKFSEYDSGSQIMRNPNNIVCYLEFLRTTAFKMFEKNESVLSRNECEIPMLSFKGKDVSVLEFPIKYLFENTSTNIEFIHKSIYEYFVSEYIFVHIKNIMTENNSEENVAQFLSCSLLKNILSFEILEFLKFKINTSELNEKNNVVNKAFDLMTQNGMTFYTNKSHRNVMDCEMKVFKNMLYVVHLWDKYIWGIGKLIRGYLKYNHGIGLDLSKLNFYNAHFDGVDLQYANLKETNLFSASLINADLRGACLEKANLKGACLDASIWSERDISKAILQLKEANFSYILIEKGNKLEVMERKKLFPDEI